MLRRVSMISTVLLVALLIGATTAWTLDAGTPVGEMQQSRVPQSGGQPPSDVPFDVLRPGTLPEGYELASRELVRKGQSGSLTEEQAQEVTGVVLQYLETETAPGAQKGTIFIEQKLGSKNSGSEIAHASKTGQESIRG